MEDNVLVHYGILGMKWGVRRTEAQLARARAKRENKETKKDRKAAVKNRRILSDSDINQRIDRLQKEQRLKDLTAQDLNPGRHAAANILKSSGTKVLSAAAAGAAAYAVKAAMTKKFDIFEAASYIAANPNKKK